MNEGKKKKKLNALDLPRLADGASVLLEEAIALLSEARRQQGKRGKEENPDYLRAEARKRIAVALLMVTP